MTNIDDNVERLVEPSAKRAGEKFLAALNEFTDDEMHRNPDFPAWIVLAAVADGMGVVLGSAFAFNVDEKDRKKSGGLGALFALARLRADSVVSWLDKNKSSCT